MFADHLRRLRHSIAAAVLLLAVLHDPSTLSASEARLEWRMASAFSSKLPIYGDLAVRFSQTVEAVSGGDIQISFAEPGELIDPIEAFDAIAAGQLDAAWSSPAHWVGKDEGLAVFSGIPFGPSAEELAAWLYQGEGQALMDQIYAQHGIKSIICGVTPAEASGWYREEIQTPADFEGKKLRFFGLGGLVLERLGAELQRLRGDEILLALSTGRIDGAEINMPAIDVTLGFEEAAPYYYFPSWHQQAGILELLVNRSLWESLSEKQRRQIELSCGDNFREALALGFVLQGPALATLSERGVNFRSWSPEVLKALERAWKEVAIEISNRNENFKKAWLSLRSFKENHNHWRYLRYLTPQQP